MNETMETILNRHSTRKFLDKEITSEDKNIIYNAIQESPSAGNMQQFSVIEVQNKEKLDRLSILCDNQPFIKDAKLVLFFVVNPLRYYDTYNVCNEEQLKPTIADFYLGLNDAIIAAQTAVLAAESLGIGSCYIGDIIENVEEVKEMFQLPKYVNPACLLVFGYKPEKGSSPKRFMKNDLFAVDTFQNESTEAFIRKFDHLEYEEAKKKVYQAVTATVNRKMKAPFYEEMNRAFTISLNEYLDLNVMFKSILEMDRAAIVVCDLNHRIVYMNPKAKDAYKKHGDLLGKSVLSCHNPKSVEIIHQVVSWFKEDTKNNMIYTFRNEKQNKDVYMVALRDEQKNLIGYYEKHEYRTVEQAKPYDFSTSLV